MSASPPSPRTLRVVRVRGLIALCFAGVISWELATLSSSASVGLIPTILVGVAISIAYVLERLGPVRKLLIQMLLRLACTTPALVFLGLIALSLAPPSLNQASHNYTLHHSFRRISVIASPPDALVFVDDSLYGSANDTYAIPLTAKTLSVRSNGYHTQYLSLSQYADSVFAVTLNAAQ